MNRFIITTLIALTALSCSKSGGSSSAQVDEPISFKTLNTIVNSRVANDNNDNYKVYAIATIGESASSFIGGEAVEPTNNAIVSGASYYWPIYEGAQIDFYAYAPSSLSFEPDSSGKTSTWSYSVPDSGNEDFTIAMPISRVCPALDSETGGVPDDSDYTSAVEFAFYHQLSHVTFEIALSETLQKAGFTLNTDNSYIKFTVQHNTATFDYNALSTEKSNISGSKSSTGNNITYSNKMGYYIIPQTGALCTIELINVKVYSPTDIDVLADRVITPYIISSSDNISFSQGYLYSIKITLDDSLTTGDGDDVFTHIEISSTTLNDWMSETGSQTDTTTDDWTNVEIE